MGCVRTKDILNPLLNTFQTRFHLQRSRVHFLCFSAFRRERKQNTDLFRAYHKSFFEVAFDAQFEESLR